jgi:hypothetical protein
LQERLLWSSLMTEEARVVLVGAGPAAGSAAGTAVGGLASADKGKCEATLM